MPGPNRVALLTLSSINISIKTILGIIVGCILTIDVKNIFMVLFNIKDPYSGYGSDNLVKEARMRPQCSPQSILIHCPVQQLLLIIINKDHHSSSLLLTSMY